MTAIQKALLQRDRDNAARGAQSFPRYVHGETAVDLNVNGPKGPDTFGPLDHAVSETRRAA